MAEDKSKKPKIDLKARLGKTAVGGAAAGPSAVPLPIPGSSGGSVPPPMTSSPGMSTPVPVPMPSTPGIAPPPSMVASIQPGLPGPFGQPQRSVPAAAPSRPVAAAAQTIKVEIGEEIHAERAKASKKTALMAAGALVLGIGFGFAIGGAKERSDRGYVAIEGAGALEKEIKAANEKLDELRTKLAAGEDKLKNKTYPDELVADLAALNIPFEAANLEHKQVGSLAGTVQRALFNFTSGVDDVNKSKNQLRNLFGQPEVKKAVEKAWADEKAPVANFSVVLIAGKLGMVAELVPTKEPFSIEKDWPASYPILRVERTQAGAKQVEKKATRWQKGDPSRDLAGTDPVVIPVDPDSSSALTSQEIIRKLGIAARDLREKLEGNASDPSNPIPGLIKVGSDLVNELHKIAAQK